MNNSSMISNHHNIIKITIIMLLLFSCDWSQTVVTSYIHRDGSVTRKVTMKSGSETINHSDYRVPVDSSWSFSDTIEVEDNDTIRILTAVKDFSSVAEINKAYDSDSGSNKHLKRHAGFTKKFRWFYTYYYYTEGISKLLSVDVIPEDYLKGAGMEIFYHPEILTDSMLESADSLLYKEQKNKADSAEEIYVFTALFEEWISDYILLSHDSSVVAQKDSLIAQFDRDVTHKDSMIISVLGVDYYQKNKTDIDSSFILFEEKLGRIMASEYYTCEFVMPGKIISTNGFVDKTGKISWPVDSKYFLTRDYRMFAESRSNNIWIWLVSAGILLLLSLLIARRRKTKSDKL